jgi:hypothetical protein
VFPILAPLPVSTNATALAFFTFIRSFANTWGITISGTVLQNELKTRLPSAFTSQFPGGVEIAFAAIPVVKTLPEPLKAEVQQAFADSLRVVWYVLIGIAGLGLLSVGLMKEVPMVAHKNEAYALKEDGTKQSDVEKA